MKSPARSTTQMGAIIHRERRLRGLTQAQLGAKTGLRQATVSKLEKGEPATRLSTLFDVLATLNLELTVSSRDKTPKQAIGDDFNARSRTHVPLGVFLNGRRVGRLRKEASGSIDFQYEGSWLEWEHTFPISLSLPLREDRYVGTSVIAVFDNLLPDSNPIRRRLAERVRAEGDDAYSMLTAIGRDCVGALQFLPGDEEPEAIGKPEGEIVSDERVAAILANLVRTPLGVSVEEEFRISIAGAQEKTALLYWKGHW